MKPTHCLLVCLLSLGSAAAVASGPCYTVYGKDNKVIYRSEEPPIDLSQPIYVGMAKRFPGGHLVTQIGAYECPLMFTESTRPANVGIGANDSPALQLRPTSRSAKRTHLYGAAPSGNAGKRSPGSATETVAAGEASISLDSYFGFSAQ